MLADASCASVDRKACVGQHVSEDIPSSAPDPFRALLHAHVEQLQQEELVSPIAEFIPDSRHSRWLPSLPLLLTQADVVVEKRQEISALLPVVAAGGAGAPGPHVGRGVVQVVGGDCTS